MWSLKTIGLISLKSGFPAHIPDLAIGFFELMAVCFLIYSSLTFWLGPRHHSCSGDVNCEHVASLIGGLTPACDF